MEHLVAAAKQILNLDLTPPQVAAFQTYAKELAEWNEKFNLTAIKNPVDVEIKHFADSLSCLLALGPRQATPLTLIDVGSGAGFPGLPLKLICPDLRLTLVESVGKKVIFLEHIVAKLELKDVRALGADRSVALTTRAVQRAIRSRVGHENLLFHSDRGIEYGAYRYKAFLGEHGIRSSMNRPGHPGDNAHMESFFHSMKAEWIRGKTFKTFTELEVAVRQYIRFYNHHRLHSGIDYHTPAEYERLYR